MSYPKQVLLIDDDEDDCFIFGSVINELGNDIEFFYDCDSERALKRLADITLPVPDLLFLDWNMPKKNGKECLAVLRKLPQCATLPIIIISTSTALRDREAARRLGASYFISKPSTFSELQQLLEHILSLPWN